MSWLMPETPSRPDRLDQLDSAFAVHALLFDQMQDHARSREPCPSSANDGGAADLRRAISPSRSAHAGAIEVGDDNPPRVFRRPADRQLARYDHSESAMAAVALRSPSARTRARQRICASTIYDQRRVR